MFKWYKLNFCRKITSWSRYNKDKKRYEHNHIEPGWITTTRPQGHPSWKSGLWMRSTGWLDSKNRVHIGELPWWIDALITFGFFILYMVGLLLINLLK